MFTCEISKFFRTAILNDTHGQLPLCYLSYVYLFVKFG